jgi:hypothetical protein
VETTPIHTHSRDQVGRTPSSAASGSLAGVYDPPSLVELGTLRELTLHHDAHGHDHDHHGGFHHGSV